MAETTTPGQPPDEGSSDETVEVNGRSSALAPDIPTQVRHEDQMLSELLEEWTRALNRARLQNFPLAPGETWSKRIFVNRRIRLQADALVRSLKLRLALDPAESETAARLRRVERFCEALEPPPSRWIILGITILIVSLAQIVLTLADKTGFGPFNSELLSKSAGGDPASLIELGGKLLTGPPIDRLAFLAAPSFAAYVVLCGIARGYGKARSLTALPESSVKKGAVLGFQEAADFPIDLAVKALLAIALIGWGAIAFVYQTSLGFYDIGPEMYWQWAIGVFGIIRLCWIGVKWSRRGYSVAPFLLAFALVAVTCGSAELAARNSGFA